MFMRITKPIGLQWVLSKNVFKCIWVATKNIPAGLVILNKHEVRHFYYDGEVSGVPSL